MASRNETAPVCSPRWGRFFWPFADANLVQRRQPLQMESEVRRAGGLGGEAAEDAGGREHRAEAAAVQMTAVSMALMIALVNHNRRV